MSRSLKKRSRAGLGAGLLGLVLMLAACQPGPPDPTPPPTEPAPSPTGTAPLPAPPGPLPTLDPPPGDSVRFTAQGDIGVGSGAQKVLDVIADLNPDLNLTLGDFSYKAGKEDEFCDMVTGKLGSDFPYQLIAGNHDSNGEDGDLEKFVRCLPNRLPGLEGEYGTQWRADVPEQNPMVRFIMVSPGIDFKDGEPLDYSPGSERWRWTEDAIDQARSEGIPWTVVGMHAPCFSVGEKSCQSGKEFTNMLIDKQVDLVLSGHDHIYQRTHQVRLGGSCPELVPADFSPVCLTDQDSTMEQGSGTVFVTVGVGGVGLYNVKNNDPEAGYFAVWSGKNRNPALGTLDVTASKEELAARFVPAEGYSFTDSFTLQRR